VLKEAGDRTRPIVKKMGGDGNGMELGVGFQAGLQARKQGENIQDVKNGV